MRCLLRVLCSAVIFAACAWWIATGARLGWWQTRVGVERVDEITGLSVVEWQERLVPGVETPLLGLALGGAGFAATLVFRRSLPTTQKPTS